MKIYHELFSASADSKKSSFQLMSKECTVWTGKLRPRRLLMIRMAMITDHLVKERTSREITL